MKLPRLLRGSAGKHSGRGLVVRAMTIEKTTCIEQHPKGGRLIRSNLQCTTTTTYVRILTFDSGVPERRTDIYGHVRMGVFLGIGASLMQVSVLAVQ